MIEVLRHLFDTNQEIVYFVYGQAFFVLGLAILLQSRKYSRLELAGSLPYLAGFGLVHGLVEWGYVFIPIQATYLPWRWVMWLRLAQLFLLVLSFVFLLLFGLRLTVGNTPRRGIVLALPWALLGLYTGAVLYELSIHSPPHHDVFTLAEIAARYTLAFPGALLAAYSLRQHTYRRIAPLSIPHIIATLRAAGWALAAYAVLGGLVVPPANFFPADRLNTTLFLVHLGIPVAVFRSLAGLTLALSIIRAMEVFQIEIGHLMAESERARIVAEDRERIGRELHDSTIQAIYAAGLLVEDAAQSLPEQPDSAKEKLAVVSHHLNRTIQDIRRYIFDLRQVNGSADLVKGLQEIVHDFQVNTLLETHFHTDMDSAIALGAEQVQHILRIAREALSNISRHAQARQVMVHLSMQNGRLYLEIRDDGVGFDLQARRTAGGQGLLNMGERAERMGGRLTIDSAPGQGTTVTLEVPLGERR